MFDIRILKNTLGNFFSIIQKTVVTVFQQVFLYFSFHIVSFALTHILFKIFIVLIYLCYILLLPNDLQNANSLQISII
jgi:hypothetical protein